MSDEILSAPPPGAPNDGAEPSPEVEAPARKSSVLEIIGGGVALLSVIAALFYILHQRDYQPAVAPTVSKTPVIAAVSDGHPASSEPAPPVVVEPQLTTQSRSAWQPVQLPSVARSELGADSETNTVKLKKCCAFLHTEERRTGAKEKAAFQRAAASCDKARALITSGDSPPGGDLAGPVLSAFEDALQQAHLPSCESESAQ
jgi:hypothetical protein